LWYRISLVTAHLNPVQQCQAQACRQQAAYKIFQHSGDLRNELKTWQKRSVKYNSASRAKLA